MGKKKKKSAQKADEVEKPIAIENSSNNHLRECLDEIKTYEGVVGYILRNSTSAAIDLKDPTKIIDYAILSSSAFDASEVLVEGFGLGNVESILVEGKDAKMLSLTIEENRVSVFMEKDANSEKTLKRLLAL